MFRLFVALIIALVASVGALNLKMTSTVPNVLSLRQVFQVCPSDIHVAENILSTVSTLLTDKYGVKSAGWEAVAGLPMGSMYRHSLYESFEQRKEKWSLYKNDPVFITKQNELYNLVIPGSIRDYYRSYVQQGDSINTGRIRRRTTAAIAPGQKAAAIAWALDVSKLREKLIGKKQTIALSKYGIATLTAQTEYDSWAAYDAAQATLDASAEYDALWASRKDFFIPGTMEAALFKKVFPGGQPTSL